MGLPPAEPMGFGINPKAHFPDILGPSQHTAPAACRYQGSARCVTAGYVCECSPYKYSKAVPLAAKYNFNVAPVPCGVPGLAVVSQGMPSTKAEELQKYRNTPEVTEPLCAVLAPRSGLCCSVLLWPRISKRKRGSAGHASLESPSCMPRMLLEGDCTCQTGLCRRTGGLFACCLHVILNLLEKV